MATRKAAKKKESEKKGKGLTIFVVLVILLANAAVAYWVITAREKAATLPNLPAPAIYVPLESFERPMFLVSLEDGERQRLMRIYAQAKVRDQFTADAIDENRPLIITSLNRLFSGHQFEEANTPSFKRRLKDNTLKVLNDTLKRVAPGARAESVIFTDIVVQ